MSAHIDEDGSFRDDDHPWCPPGYVAFDLSDRNLHPVLWQLAYRRSGTHPRFAAAMMRALERQGFDRPMACEECRAPAVVATETGTRCMECGHRETV